MHFLFLLLAACQGQTEPIKDGPPSETDADADVDTDSDVDGDADTDTNPTPVNPCGEASFCELFDSYSETTLVDGQLFGPWVAALSPGATMDLDATHTVSGDRALHISLDAGLTDGGRLFSTDGVPLLNGGPTHVYGRMMMYIEQSGTSIHWTFFGVEGPAEAGSPQAGEYSTYIMSSLPNSGVNTYSFVDGLWVYPVYQDCWSQGSEPMPVGEWSCVSFEMDSVARKLRMSVNGGSAPIVSVDNTGQGCVYPSAPDSLWYGPEIEDLFVGAWSFHDMDAPLELWIDDLVVDTAPVECP